MDKLRHAMCQVFIFLIIQIDISERIFIINFVVRDRVIIGKISYYRIADKSNTDSLGNQMIGGEKLVQLQMVVRLKAGILANDIGSLPTVIVGADGEKGLVFKKAEGYRWKMRIFVDPLFDFIRCHFVTGGPDVAAVIMGHSKKKLFLKNRKLLIDGIVGYRIVNNDI